jgi:hypothetical protein
MPYLIATVSETTPPSHQLLRFETGQADGVHGVPRRRTARVSNQVELPLTATSKPHT